MKKKINLTVLILGLGMTMIAQNVGINHPSPQYPLHILRGGDLVGTALNIHTNISGGNDQAGLIRFTNTVNNDNTGSFSSFIGGGRGAGDDSYLVFGTSTWAIAPTEMMRLSGTGSLGIGTTNPQAQLHTTGTARFDGGVLLPTNGGTASTLNHYEETTALVLFHNAANVYASNYLLKITRVGKQVTLTFPTDLVTMVVSGVGDIVCNNIPQRFLPLTSIYIPVRIRNTGFDALGLFWFNNNVIWIKPSATGGLWNGPNSGIYATSITYSVQ